MAKKPFKGIEKILKPLELSKIQKDTRKQYGKHTNKKMWACNKDLIKYLQTKERLEKYQKKHGSKIIFSNKHKYFIPVFGGKPIPAKKVPVFGPGKFTLVPDTPVYK